MAKRKNEPSEFDRFEKDDVPTVVITPEVLGVAVEDSVPIEGTDLHEVKVLITPDASTYQREKWNPTAKTLMHTQITGAEAPKPKYKDGANPLLIECYDLFRTLQAGGAINPYNRMALESVDKLIGKVGREICNG